MVFRNMLVAVIVLLSCAAVGSPVFCQTGDAKIVLDSADKYLDKPRRYFETDISRLKPVPQKMHRISGDKVDILYKLKDGTMITVRFYGEGGSQVVHVIFEGNTL